MIDAYSTFYEHFSFGSKVTSEERNYLRDEWT
jgi:hypothetical protein